MFCVFLSVCSAWSQSKPKAKSLVWTMISLTTHFSPHGHKIHGEILFCHSQYTNISKYRKEGGDKFLPHTEVFRIFLYLNYRMRSVLYVNQIEKLGVLINVKWIIKESGNVNFNIPHRALTLIW